MSKTPRKRGRPATIDIETAMQAVMELFRAKGFAAVSLDDLSEATGLSRPSLYRAFGDKLAMYTSAMDAFVHQVEEMAVPVLMQEGGLATALTRFYNEMLTLYYRDDGIEAGCLVYATAPSSADMPAVKSRLQESIQQLDSAMRERIKVSYPKVSDSQREVAVSIASNTLMAFSARAKSGASKEDLSIMGAQSAHAICTLLESPH